MTTHGEASDHEVVDPLGVVSDVLGLDDDELSSCVACGLCLPHCPTFRATGHEALSPRGRIDAMRAVQWRGAPLDDQFVEFMETCVLCRGCEPACPSGVPFGRLMDGTREVLAAQRRITSRWHRLGLTVLRWHRLVLLGSTVLALAQRLRLVPSRLGLARLPLRRGARVRAVAAATPELGSVWLFTGCVMDAWMRGTHRSLAAVLTSMGVGIEVPGSGAACCGALHHHAGLGDHARRLAERVMAAMPGDAAIVVDSAGCGAALADYGRLLGTPEAQRFSERVIDANAFVAAHVERLPPTSTHLGAVVVQDPCHLRHVQREHLAVRTVLARVAEPVELDDDGLCCGAGGAYAALEPELAGRIRDRKLAEITAAVERSGATTVASANPGCAMHLAAAGLDTRHPMDLLAEGLGLGHRGHGRRGPGDRGNG